MSLVCKDGISLCSGCGYCRTFSEKCDVCHRPMKDGEIYYKLFRKTVCGDCAALSERGEVCSLCKRPCTEGIHFQDIILCRSCSGVATGYIGYV